MIYMHVILRFLTWSLLRLSLLVFFLSLIVSYVVLNPQTYKSSLVESNAYEEFVPALAEQLKNNSESNDQQFQTENPGVDQQGQSVMVDGGPDQDKSKEKDVENLLPFEDPKIELILSDSISPDIIQGFAETLIDSLFAWADGTTEDFMFEFDLLPVRQNLLDNFTAYVEEEIETLPQCVGDEEIADIEVFELKCTPAGFSTDRIKQEIELGLSGSDFLDGWKITQDSFSDQNDNGDNKSFTENLDFVPSVHSGTKTALLASAVGVILSIALFILARKPLDNALSKLGRTLLSFGLLFVIPLLIVKIIAPGQLDNLLPEDGGRLPEIGLDVGEVLVAKIINFGLIVSTVIVAIGFALLVFEHYGKLSAGTKTTTMPKKPKSDSKL